MRLYMTLSLVACMAASSVSAQAQTITDKYISVSALAASETVATAATTTTVPVQSVLTPIAPKVGSAHVLPMLWASMAALQTMDIVSTRNALSHGAVEANPVFGPAGASVATTVALKAGATAGIMLLTQHLSKTHHVAAIVTMIALNSAYATVVAHNYAAASASSIR